MAIFRSRARADLGTGPEADLALGISEEGHQGLERLLVGVMIEEDRAPSTHLPVAVLEALADRRQVTGRYRLEVGPDQGPHDGGGEG